MNQRQPQIHPELALKIAYLIADRDVGKILVNRAIGTEPWTLDTHRTFECGRDLHARASKELAALLGVPIGTYSLADRE